MIVARALAAWFARIEAEWEMAPPDEVVAWADVGEEEPFSRSCGLGDEVDVGGGGEDHRSTLAAPRLVL